ncbi:MAG: hypothetical protein WA947_17050 [Phormidesmis sp.]
MGVTSIYKTSRLCRLGTVAVREVKMRGPVRSPLAHRLDNYENRRSLKNYRRR